MAKYQFKLPDIGEGIAEAEIVAWHIKLGDRVEEDQQLADMMTDKATVEMESPVAGKVVELAGEVGDLVPIGSVLVVIETDEQAPVEAAAADSKNERPLGDGAHEPTKAQEEEIPVTAVESPKQPVRPERSAPEASAVEGRASTSLSTNEGGDSAPEKVLASPAVRARARDLGIELGQVKAKDGRIRHSDLDSFIMYQGGSVSSRPSGPARQDESIKIVGLRRKIAENMAEANRRIPHFTIVEEFDVTALEETRAMMNRDRADNPKLTLLPFLVTAMAKALADWPMLNATFDDEAMTVTRHGSVDMGIATQTQNGLMVPVVRGAERMSVWQLASEIARLSEAARTNKATRDELTGPTFTISSLGPMGGIASTPVINPPQVAIVAVNKIEERLVPIDDEIEVRKRMNLSLSCDHRVVDGWDAASFL
ncbi:MAG: 2-oxo acid dehydrogenase subunit E2, partial [Pseudomonadota bacterium]|nr:2-oxo acid dehydrogenase subunit E2 [Pseudomonadota bacterium]